MVPQSAMVVFGLFHLFLFPCALVVTIWMLWRVFYPSLGSESRKINGSPYLLAQSQIYF